MNNEDLARKLNSVGKSAFIKYYGIFQSYGQNQISREDCIERILADGISNESGASIRCSNAKLIFQEGKQCDALRIICESQKLPSAIVKTAKRMLKATCDQ